MALLRCTGQPQIKLENFFMSSLEDKEQIIRYTAKSALSAQHVRTVFTVSTRTFLLWVCTLDFHTFYFKHTINKCTAHFSVIPYLLFTLRLSKV